MRQKKLQMPRHPKPTKTRALQCILCSAMPTEKRIPVYSPYQNLLGFLKQDEVQLAKKWLSEFEQFKKTSEDLVNAYIRRLHPARQRA